MKKKRIFDPSSLPTRGKKTGAVRIFAGKWKRTPLPVIDLDGLRPTGNRIRETVFDWLTFLLGGYSGKRALDMFAGSGALGLEFASRGGTSVLIERDPQNARNLSDVCAKLKAGDDAVVRRGDSLTLTRSYPERSFDVVFIDPPFAAGLPQSALSAAARVLTDDGLIYLESPSEHEMPVPEDFAVLRSGSSGAVRYQLLARKASPLADLAKED